MSNSLLKFMYSKKITMKRNILLPTDFSKYAWNALNYAIELFKDDDCEFFILNTFRVNGYVLESMMVPEPGEHLYEIAKKQSNEGLEKVFQQIIATKGQKPNHKFTLISKFNFLVEAMKHLVDKKGIDLIVMGTKGATDATATVYGSNTIDAMEQIRSCPVLAIPATTAIKKPQEIVFPNDYKIDVTEKELSPLIEIATKTKASIKVLHVVDGEEKLSNSQKENKQLLETYFKGLDYSFHTLDNADTNSGINCFVESRDSDLITFINKKHSFFGSILSRPLVKSLGLYSKVPVLAMHK